MCLKRPIYCDDDLNNQSAGGNVRRELLTSINKRGKSKQGSSASSSARSLLITCCPVSDFYFPSFTAREIRSKVNGIQKSSGIGERSLFIVATAGTPFQFRFS